MDETDEGGSTIGELAQRAGVTIRTIRYYIAQQLLPSPVSRGPNTRYTEDHLIRLRLIGQLKQDHLPLELIRKTIDGLSTEEMKRLLAERGERAERADRVDPAGEPSRRVSDPGQARSYIARVLERSWPSAGTEPFPLDLSDSHRVRYALDAPEPTAPAPPATVPPAPAPPAPGFREDADTRESETWERIRLGDGLELHVRRPLPPDAAALLESLLESARRASVSRPVPRKDL